MAMDSSECNGSAEAPRVELEGKAGVEFGSEKDLVKSDGIASNEREVNDQDEIGGPFVIINGDSDNPSEKILELDEKADPETTGEDKVSPTPLMYAGNEIEGKEEEGEVELESGSDPAQEGPSLENPLNVASELGGKLEVKSKEGTENGELSENGENNLELRGSGEKKELSEETVFEEISQDKGKDQELDGTAENKYSSAEAVVEENSHEKGQECESSLADELNSKKDANLVMHQSETINGEDDGSELVFESGEQEEEEHPVSGSIEGNGEENGRMDELETIVGEPDRHGELDISSTAEEQVPQEVEQEATIVPSVQIMNEESGTLSDSLDAQKEAEMPVSALENPTLNLAVEAESEQNHERQQEVHVPSQEEEIHEESQGASDSLQGNNEVEMPETESKEWSLLDLAVGVESELKHEVQQVGSGPSQVNEQHELSEGVSDSMQSNKGSDTPGTELNNQSPLDSAVKVESEQKLEEQQESSIISQEEEIHEEAEVPVPSDGKNEFMEAPEPDLKEMPLPDFETESKVVHGTVAETKIEDQHTVTTFCSGKENGESETSISPILFEEEKRALCFTSPDQEKCAESETKKECNLLEANGESETDVFDTLADKKAPSESTKEVEKMQNSGGDAAWDAQAVSASHEFEIDSRSVKEYELVESSNEVLADSENKSTSVVEESETETDVFDTLADKKAPSESTKEVEKMQNSWGSAAWDAQAVSASHEFEIDSRSVKEYELVESSNEVLADSENKSTSVVEESETETDVFDTLADKKAPSESTKEVEKMQNSGGDAAWDAQAVSASHEFEIDSRSVKDYELVESSNEVLADSENKSTSVVEESDRSVTEFEDSQLKAEAETVSVSSNDASAREIGLEDSVQIGKFKISIGENGPAILQQELQENSETTQAAMPEEPETSTSNEEKPEVQPLKRQAIYIIKVPRYSDEEQWEKIQEAQARLDELTRTRDAIRDIMQKRRKACSDSWDEVVKAKEEERAARAVFNAKRHEISTVQSVINKLNKANSIDDMDDLIEMKEKSLQHETMTLKQEKMLIQEIKELKTQRKKLIDNMGSAAEIDEAFDQKDSVFDKLKTLKAELEVLGKTLTKAEAKTRAAQQAYDEIDLSFCTLQDEYKSADEVRQKAYLYWRDLKSGLASKNKHFFNYRDDQKRAASFLGHNPPDKEGVRLYCSRQVEKMMDLWNSDAEFRKQYVNSNKVNTLRRLRTLDGRSLGPDEVPPVLPTTSTAYRRISTPLIPATNEIRLEKSTRVSSSASIQSNEFPELPHGKQKVSLSNSRNNKGTSSKEKLMDRPVVTGIVPATVESAQMEKKREEDEMERRKREEEDRARREEDIKRKAKAEAEEKERLREEQKAKAKEAEERKKRKAEKAQERAEFKARKEAEIRDKKRAKKDKKKTAEGESDNGDTINSLSAEGSAPSEIADIKDVTPAAPTTATRRTTRPQAALKQLKRVEPVPVALRNRGRRKVRSWIIGIVTAIAALLTVFFIGNYVNFSDISSLVWL